MMSVQDNIDVACILFDSYSKHDIDSMVAPVAEDVEWLDVPSGTAFRGKDGFRKLWVTHG